MLKIKFDIALKFSPNRGFSYKCSILNDKFPTVIKVDFSDSRKFSVANGGAIVPP